MSLISILAVLVLRMLVKVSTYCALQDQPQGTHVSDMSESILIIQNVSLVLKILPLWNMKPIYEKKQLQCCLFSKTWQLLCPL